MEFTLPVSFKPENNHYEAFYHCLICLMMTVFCHARTSIYQLPIDSTDWKVYYMQGEEYYRKGKLQKSLSNYQKALSIHVSDTVVHALANCYYQRGYYQQSIELYNTFIKEDSSETKLNTIAKCYDKLENQTLHLYTAK